jgi:hypothetical protein
MIIVAHDSVVLIRHCLFYLFLDLVNEIQQGLLNDSKAGGQRLQQLCCSGMRLMLPVDAGNVDASRQQEAAAQADAGEDGTATLAQQPQTPLTMAGREHVISPSLPVLSRRLRTASFSPSPESFVRRITWTHHGNRMRPQRLPKRRMIFEMPLQARLSLLTDCGRDNWQIRLRDGLIACQPAPEAGLSGANAIIVGRGVLVEIPRKLIS